MQSLDAFLVTLFGGAKGGGKSHGLRNIFLLRRFKYPKSHGAIFRRTYGELEGNHIRPLFSQFPTLLDYWNDTKKLLTLPNGSTLEFCHCKNEIDVKLYQGREFHDLGVDEAGQWTEGMFRELQGSNRSSIPGIRACGALTANPGGIGHAWLKRLFIERRYNERERSGDYTFIQALVDDNQALLENDPDYVHRLNTEPNEALRKAYRFGDWDIFAGQYFGELRREIHFIQPFDIPKHWNRFGAYDFGFNHPGAFGWFAVDEDGNVYLYREFIKNQLRIDEFAKEINRYEDTAKLAYISAGHDCWANKGVLRAGSPPTIAEEFLNHNITLIRASIDRILGATQLRNHIAWQNLPERGNKPRFYIFNNCPITYDTISRMQHDPNRIEDVLKQDATDGDPYSGDDAYDMVRYGLMSRPAVTDALPKRIIPGTVAYANHIKADLDQKLQDQIDRQTAEENNEDYYNIMDQGLDDNVATYYINKKRGK